MSELLSTTGTQDGIYILTFLRLAGMHQDCESKWKMTKKTMWLSKLFLGQARLEWHCTVYHHPPSFHAILAATILFLTRAAITVGEV